MLRRLASSLRLRPFSSAISAWTAARAQEPRRCLVIHPVTYPSRGRTHELHAADEAIRLVRALDWTVVNEEEAV